MADPVYALVRERDHYGCRVCGSAQMLEVHHILFRSQGGPDEDWNLISLCKQCHMRAHGAGDRLKRDLLHAMVELGVSGEREIKTCRTCKNRDADYVCTVDALQRFPTFSCPSWEEN